MTRMNEAGGFTHRCDVANERHVSRPFPCLSALWTGITPNIMRNSVINAAELASYDQVKSSLMATGMEDGVPLHLLSGLGAGFVACCVG